MSEGLHLGVPSSFLQDRVMGKINADTANLALLLLLLRRRGPGLKQAVSIYELYRSEGHKTHGKTNTDLLDSKYFILHLFFQFLAFFKSIVTCGALFFIYSITSEN